MAAMTASDVLTQGAAAAGFAKVLVDVTKLTLVRMPRNYLPLAALFFSELCAFLLVAMGGSLSFDRQTISAVVLMGIGATAGAMAITSAQTKADRVEERVDAALDLPSGSTKADVEAAINPPEPEDKS